MVNKIAKIILKIMIILLLIQTIQVPVVEAVSWNKIIISGDNFIKQGKDAQNSDDGQVVDQAKMKKVVNNIYNLLLTLGVVLSVIIGAILGIQIMWGSIEQQVKAKEMLMPYAIGCLVIFGAFGIWKLVVTILAKL